MSKAAVLPSRSTRAFAVRLSIAAALAALVTASACSRREAYVAGETPPPPATRTVATADTMHGVTIEDPYRWLEDFEAEEQQAWIEAQNAYTADVLGQHPDRAALRARLDELFKIGGIGIMWQRGDRLFFTRRDADDEQFVLYVQEGADGAPTELIDPERLREDAPVGLDWWYPTHDGQLLAYGISESGSELSTLHVMDVDTRELLPDRIPNTRAASLSWEPDGTAFFYTRFPAAGEVPDDELHFHRRVYHHTLGDDPADDPLVFGGGLDMTLWTGASLSMNGRFLLAYVYRGSSREDLFVKDLELGGGFVPIVEGVEARSSGFAIDRELFMYTTHEAPRGRIVRVDLTNPSIEHWVELVPETEHTLQSFLYVGGEILARYLENAYSRVRIHALDGTYLRDLPLPEYSSIMDWTGDWRGREVFVGIDSYLIPPTVYRYDLETGESELAMSVDAPIDTEPYETEQVWYPSKDGTEISMFLVHRKDIELDGTNPTLLSGYGGFAASSTPGFARNRFLWMDSGGVYADPNLRGGGEYGEEWHRAGKLENKQNSFDDFIAAAEWLVDAGYTSPEHLAVRGGSNGGLLIGAFVTQRPDLARAAICDVPLLDMVRFDRFYAARIWTPEYGSPADPEQFAWLYAYSPYHHVREEERYPAVLFTTAESDSRVHPSHAMKTAARMQAATASGRPVLLRFERQAGHGSGTPMSMILDLYTDYYSFLFRELGLRY